MSCEHDCSSLIFRSSQTSRRRYTRSRHDGSRDAIDGLTDSCTRIAGSGAALESWATIAVGPLSVALQDRIAGVRAAALTTLAKLEPDEDTRENVRSCVRP